VTIFGALFLTAGFRDLPTIFCCSLFRAKKSSAKHYTLLKILAGKKIVGKT